MACANPQVQRQPSPSPIRRRQWTAGEMPDATSSPAFPANKKNQPNPHPYSIKTTSSALLSWSNSSPSHSVQPVKHHYVPPSPTRARRGDASRDMSHRVGGNDMPHPPPLPTPPTVFSGSCSSFASTEVFSAPQRKRAETLPSGTVNSFMHTDDPSIRDGDLSSNPEEWTMEQLLTHLSTSFTMEKDTEMSSAGVMLDWVRKRGFTGWQWLRLTDTDVIRYVYFFPSLLFPKRAQKPLVCPSRLRRDLIYWRIPIRFARMFCEHVSEMILTKLLIHPGAHTPRI